MANTQRLISEAANGKTIYRNEYICPKETCKFEWRLDWSAQCEDECPKCGNRAISPVKSLNITHRFHAKKGLSS